MSGSSIDWQSLDLSELGHWPWAAKSVLLAFTFVALIGLGTLGWLKPIYQQVNAQKASVAQLKKNYATAYHKAALLPQYEAQLQSVQASLANLVDQLPVRTQVPALLEEISHRGLSNGLVFRAIRLAPEVQTPFLIELPIEIEVDGTFHDLAKFLADVTQMPRIVTIHDFELVPLEMIDDEVALETAELRLIATAKTYRYAPQAPSGE